MLTSVTNLYLQAVNQCNYHQVEIMALAEECDLLRAKLQSREAIIAGLTTEGGVQ
jgi:hypothetical protein